MIFVVKSNTFDSDPFEKCTEIRELILYLGFCIVLKNEKGRVPGKMYKKQKTGKVLGELASVVL